MQVRVLFFGLLKEIAASPDQTIELPEGSTVESLFAHYLGQFPQLEGLAGSIAIARNQQFAQPGEALADGDEIAFLPPVSGGTAYSHHIETPEGHFFAITREPIDTGALRDKLLQGCDGAICIFEGVVRNQSGGRSTRYLDYECYEAMAIRLMAEIGAGIASRHAVSRIGIVHRLGRMEIGEASVVVAVSSPHRRPSFDAALEGINRLKSTVPIWKKEYFVDGEVWVEGAWDDSVIRARP
jgi:molybdopterin converting factor subunit 1